MGSKRTVFISMWSSSATAGLSNLDRHVWYIGLIHDFIDKSLSKKDVLHPTELLVDLIRFHSIFYGHKELVLLVLVMIIIHGLLLKRIVIL